MTVSPPRTICPTATVGLARSGRKTSMREPEFHDPEALSGMHLLADPRTADDAARQDADYLPRDDGLAVAAFDPDFAALIDRRRLVAVGRQELAGRVADPGHRARRRDAVDVHIHRRQEDADLLPFAFRRRAGRRGPSHQDPAVRW